MIIQRELNDPRLMGMPSITRVKVSADLSVADVYLTVMGTPGQQTAALNALRHSAGLMRTRLAGALALRVVPYLKFYLDEDLKREIAVLDLLRKVAEERAQREGGEAGQAGGPDQQAEGPDQQAEDGGRQADDEGEETGEAAGENRPS